MKKGFTLVEVVGVIIILGIVALLAFPQLLNLIRNTNSKLSEASETLIFSATSQYVTKYNDNYVVKNGNIYCITIRDLVKENYLTQAIEDENLGDYGLDTKIQINVMDSKYVYSINNACAEVIQ